MTRSRSGIERGFFFFNPHCGFYTVMQGKSDLNGSEREQVSSRLGDTYH